MKTFYYLFLIMALKPVYADSLKVIVEPSDIVVNENFELIFEIESLEKSDAKISFNPARAKILSKGHGGVSVNATVINGKVTVKRVSSHRYTLETDRPGLLVIKDIKVKLGKKILNHKNIRINVGRRKKTTSKDMFLLAIPTKTSVYLGEGFNVRYYLYYRVPIVEQITDFFPKLNGFFKRTPNNIPSREETVEHEGMIYKRILLYSYRLYPEKTGKLKIDAYGVEVGYLQSKSRQGSFWRLGGGTKRTRKVRSKKITIEVLPLPVENVPNNFVGLIEDHGFKVSINKERFLVNEVVELRLEVTGPGALEQLAPPSIYKHEHLEAFDVKSSIAEINERKATKKFDYTFLTRGLLNIASKDLKIHLFDPANDQYFEKVITIPGISVHGDAVKEKKQPVKKEDLDIKDETEEAVQNVRERILLAPVFSQKLSSLAFPWVDYLNIILGLFIIIFLLWWFFQKYVHGKKNEIHTLMKDFSKGKLEYAKIHRFISLLNERTDNVDIQFVIKNSKLSPGAQKYFINLLDSVSKKQYGAQGNNVKIGFNSKYFKEVFQILLQKS